MSPPQIEDCSDLHRKYLLLARPAQTAAVLAGISDMPPAERAAYRSIPPFI
jgi:hypothetical protein